MGLRTGLPTAAVLAFSGAALLAAVAILLTLERGRPPPPGYDLDAARYGRAAVPRHFARTLPVERLRAAEPVARKRMFLATLLPLVLRENEAVLADRRRLRAVAERLRAGRTISGRERSWLARLGERYGAPARDVDTLLRRVDVIPPALALAQGAIETGWGTSRFAEDGNALFGIWTWDEDAGLVPGARPEGARNAVRAYGSLAESVRHYVLTLNTHPAYRPLRELRAALRRQGERLDARRLAAALGAYAEDGRRYVRLISQVIGAERLWELDRAALAAD